jgi:hypothetical protein
MSKIQQIKYLEIIGPSGRCGRIQMGRYSHNTFKRLFDYGVKFAIKQEKFYCKKDCAAVDLKYFIVKMNYNHGYEPNHLEYCKEYSRGEMPYDKILRYYYE